MKIKRRTFGFLAGASVAALKAGRAGAQTSADPSLLKTTLTPFGSERAGNADGSIPAWTGGYTTLPDGWKPGQAMPDFFAGDPLVVTIDSSNMAQYADRLSEGVMALMTKYGFSIKVYPTHRSHSMPQPVYDNIAKNFGTAAFIDPANPQNGFTGGYGGIPFVIPDTSKPLMAGVQIIYNHENRWAGYAARYEAYGIVVNNGTPVMTNQAASFVDSPHYYRPDLPNVQSRIFGLLQGPAVLVGEEAESWYYNSNELTQGWLLENGEGRVRKAPEISYDTPSSFLDGAAGYDETDGFNGALVEYNWNYIGKKEMYVPYHNNGLILLPWQQAFKEQFLNPDLVRWELHRVWIVEATVRSGYRNILARRRFYLDEDTWSVGLTDSWDAHGNLFHVQYGMNCLRPDMPGVYLVNQAVHNLQTGQFALIDGPWNEKANPTIRFLPSMPDSQYDPQNMAASAQY